MNNNNPAWLWKFDHSWTNYYDHKCANITRALKSTRENGARLTQDFQIEAHEAQYSFYLKRFDALKSEAVTRGVNVDAWITPPAYN